MKFCGHYKKGSWRAKKSLIKAGTDIREKVIHRTSFSIAIDE